MTKERQNIVIAEFCGWRITDETVINPVGESRYARFKNGVDQIANIIPDYTGSLDAMAGAESNLKGSRDDEHSQLSGFIEQLSLVCGDGMEPLNVYDWDLIHSTAEQRAEALIKTIGRWEEE